MVYKKYIERNGKIYGPYIYESKRIDGKVVSQYHGTKKAHLSQSINLTPKKFLNFLIPILILTFLIVVIAPKINLTGHAVMDLKGDYIQGQPFSGTLNVALQQGEFIPENTKLIIKNNENIQEYNLFDLTDIELDLGEFYLKNKEITGQGEGYGIKGIKIESPEVYFTLLLTVQKESTEQENSSESEELIEPEQPLENTTEIEPETNETEPIETNIIPIQEEVNESQQEIQEEVNQSELTEIPEEEIIEQPIEPETTEPQSETPSESQEVLEQPIEPEIQNEEPIREETPSESEQEILESESQASPITGNIIKKIAGSIAKFFMSLGPTGNIIDSTQEIQESVNYNKEFTYTLKQGETISLISNSVKTDTESLNDAQIQITQEENEITIKTDYHKETSGFGEEYLTSQKVNIPLDLSNLNLQFEKGTLEISLVYEGKEISSLKTELEEDRAINIQETEIEDQNITIPEEESLAPELQLQTLTEQEKFTLLKTFGNSTINQEAKEYKDRIIVIFTLKDFQVEYSYQSNLPQNILNYYIERDKINWLKDIAYTLEEKKATSTPITNLTKDTGIF